MHKRKLKFNIIDVAIIIVVICSIAVLMFRDTISDFFGKPEIVAVEMMLSGETADEAFAENFKVGATVGIKSGNDINVQAVVTSAEYNENGVATIKVSLNGYKKLGRFYAENGNLLELNRICTASSNEVNWSCTLENVEFGG